MILTIIFHSGLKYHRLTQISGILLFIEKGKKYLRVVQSSINADC